MIRTHGKSRGTVKCGDRQLRARRQPCNRKALSPEGKAIVITMELWQVFWLIPRLRLLPNATFRGRGISGCGAVSAENTAAGTVAESHGIPYFETITLQSYGLTMEFQNKICFLFVIINSLQ